MIIFASDLDNTLIHSRRGTMKYLETIGGEYIFPTNLPKEAVTVELKNGETAACMSEKSVEMLKDINEQQIFIPTTTRTVKLYKRIHIFQEEIVPEYAIVSNGGIILHHGQVMSEWTLEVDRRLENATDKLVIKEKFEEIADESWVAALKDADGFFWYTQIKKDEIPQAVFEQFVKWLATQGWTYSLQERKLYFIPNEITKESAVAFLQQKLQVEEVVTAGDSTLDLGMILAFEHGYAMMDGTIKEIDSEILANKIKIEERTFFATERLLSSVKTLEV